MKPLSHSGVSSGFILMFVYAFDISSWMLTRFMRQKLVALSFPGDFQLLDFLMA